MRQKSHEKIVSKSLTKVKYKHTEPCKRDVLSALRVYRGLQPILDKFVFNDGNERTLLNLNGTIPVTYKGTTYNIPVSFWVVDDYPVQAPMGFVTPTQEMQIKISENVDHTGRITLQYLTDWKYPDSNLLSLIQICTLVFGESPPVFTKSKPPPAQVVTLQHQSSTSSLVMTSQEERTQQRSGSLTITELSDEYQRTTALSSAENVLKEKYAEEFQKTKAELECLHSTNKELLDGQERIADVIKAIDDKITEIDTHVQSLETTDSQLTSAISKLELLESSPMDPDRIVETTNALHNQIVVCSAEDAAIDDAIYVLGEALTQGRVSCDLYLKKVRNLSRRQFTLRALIQKCRSIAGLDPSPEGRE